MNIDIRGRLSFPFNLLFAQPAFLEFRRRKRYHLVPLYRNVFLRHYETFHAGSFVGHQYAIGNGHPAAYRTLFNGRFWLGLYFWREGIRLPKGTVLGSNDWNGIGDPALGDGICQN